MPSGYPGRLTQAYKPMGIGIVGYGNWGPRLARVISENALLRGICELRPEARKKAQVRHPEVKITESFDELLDDPDIDGICVAAPVAAHEALIIRALKAGKDVLVEKPLTHSVESARRCVDLASNLGRVLMGGHTFVYSPRARKMRG